MTALWILLAALLVVLLAGLGCFALACARRPQPDMADPAVLKQSKYAPLADEILSGIAFWRAQEPEDIFLPSFDGLRLHGQLVQQPESKGTILLFHGYRSSWAIDFSIVLPYYHSLGYDLLVVDERAHGQSEGDYITFGVRERRDVVTWAQYAAMHFGPAHPLILDGLSMGAATVLMAAYEKDKAGASALLADFRAVAAAGLRGSSHSPVEGETARKALGAADAAMQQISAQVNPKIVLSVLAAKFRTF